MFEQKSLDKIDGDYFNIIIADSQDVTIQSRNTGHYWYLHCSECIRAWLWCQMAAREKEVLREQSILCEVL